MPAALQINLSEAEDITLRELSLAASVPRRTRERAQALRLNHQGWQVSEIASFLDCSPQRIRVTIHRWEIQGLMGLWEAPGRGRPQRWSEADLALIETCLDEEPRTYTTEQLANHLYEHRQVKLSADRLGRILKKRPGAGSEHAIDRHRLAAPSKLSPNKQT